MCMLSLLEVCIYMYLKSINFNYYRIFAGRYKIVRKDRIGPRQDKARLIRIKPTDIKLEKISNADGLD